MEFSAYWRSLTVTNKGLSDETAKITLSVSELKRLMAKSFNKGYENRREVEEACKANQKKSNPFTDIFGM
jgi:predicted secreted protein